ncbi:unnamed protein product [Caenorhabditis auriculariae]|uniref:Uncharacterized protein n=1 Tax=Caenorhabditis auriculariae TaxID=2777116 RepID=A0A8S1HPL4_9PELO|nr:unnamed protein product [Caenorhabditis auriculariae]
MENTNRPPKPAEATGKPTRKSSSLENEKNDFKDSVLTEIIARGVYSDSFIADVINEKKEKFIGRLPWEELEKSARALFRQLEVKEEAPIRLNFHFFFFLCFFYNLNANF